MGAGDQRHVDPAGQFADRRRQQKDRVERHVERDNNAGADEQGARQITCWFAQFSDDIGRRVPA